MSPSEQNTRGIKRRRPDDEESGKDKDAKVHRKLHHALRELRKVVKRARTFEVQKTLKKLKDARRKGPESDVTKDLESQVEALKHLNYDQLAQSALMTKLKKDKTLSANTLIQAIAVKLSSDASSFGAPGTSTAKVQSRILSSKVLASEVVSIVQTLRTLLHPSVGSEDTGEATRSVHGSLHVSKKKKRTGTGPEKDAILSKDSVVHLSGEHENASDDETMANVDDGWESGTVDASSGSDGPVAGWVADHDATYGQDSSDEADIPAEDAKRQEPQPHKAEGRSAFLPSLSVGFTRGDSDDEFDDSEAKLADGDRRNRRGQRARRAIWEKKFGKNANHIKKQQPGSIPVDRQSRKGNSSFPSRTPWSCAPTGDHERSNRPTLARTQGIQGLCSTKTQSERVQRRGHFQEKQAKQPLHPSWEAKRKQKLANIVPSQGTKIVFSES